MSNTATLISICCIIVITIYRVVGYANNNYTNKVERQVDSTTKFPFSKNVLSTQESEVNFTEFTTKLPNTDTMESRKKHSTTVASELDKSLEFGRGCWIILIACLGVFFLILAIQCLRMECLSDHSGFPCQSKNCCCRKHPKMEECNLSELDPDSLEGNSSQTKNESEANRSSDSFQAEITEQVADVTESTNI